MASSHHLVSCSLADDLGRLLYTKREIDQSLRLAKGMSLHIRATSHNNGLTDESEKSFARMEPFAGRWGSVTSNRLSPKLREILESPVCNPKMLDIRTISHKSPQLQGNVPLSHLLLGGICVNWSSSRLTNLSSLRLTHILKEKCPLSYDMLRILSSSPRLQRLHLVGVRLEGHSLYTDQKTIPPMQFNHLKTLVVQNVSLQISNGIPLSSFSTSLDELRVTLPFKCLSKPDLPVVLACLQASRT